MVCRRDTGSKDQVGSPSPAVPGILEPVWGKAVVSPTVPEPIPKCLDATQQDVPLLLPPEHCLDKESSKTGTLHLSSKSLSPPVPSCPCGGTRTPAQCPSTVPWPHGSQKGPQRRGGQETSRKFHSALLLAPYQEERTKISQGRGDVGERVAGQGVVHGACP